MREVTGGSGPCFSDSPLGRKPVSRAQPVNGADTPSGAGDVPRISLCFAIRSRYSKNGFRLVPIFRRRNVTPEDITEAIVAAANLMQEQAVQG